jgi:hypothetical protein
VTRPFGSSIQLSLSIRSVKGGKRSHETIAALYCRQMYT